MILRHVQSYEISALKYDRNTKISVLNSTYPRLDSEPSVLHVNGSNSCFPKVVISKKINGF